MTLPFAASARCVNEVAPVRQRRGGRLAVSGLLVLLPLVAALFVALEPPPRIAMSPRAMPTWTCWSGADAMGHCALRTLFGGAGSFVLPAFAAALLTGVGGTLLGLGIAYGPRGLRSLARGVQVFLEALPRLVVLLMVFVLFAHRPLPVGIALGLLLIPGLAGEVAAGISRLQATDYLRFTRAHGIAETRVVGVHLLWLTCRPDVIRRSVSAFGLMLLTDVTLSFALQVNTGGEEQSWGYALSQSRGALYELAIAVSDVVSGSAPSFWPKVVALLPFVLVVGALVVELWALQTLASEVALRLEREKE